MSTRNVKFTPARTSRRSASKPQKASSSKSPRKSVPITKALRRYQTNPPRMVSSNGQVTVTHREFVQDVAGSVLFSATSFPINPARDVMFTWLSDLAARYERYQFTQLRFIYEPRCASTIAGSVILAVDYDPLDVAPVSKQDVYAYHHSAQSSPWDECVLVVDPGILTNRGSLYTRTGAAPATADLKTYDLGNLWLCVSGFANTDVCGELFVEYTVSLKIPQIQSNVQSATYHPTAGVDNTHVFGTAPLVLTGLLDATVSATTITFGQNWVGDVTCQVTGTGAGDIVFGGTATVVGGFAVVNAGTTVAVELNSVTAKRGQTLIVDVSGWTTVSDSIWTFAPTS